MIHVAAFSGGKDSTALLLWLREQGITHETVICDTGWEHPLTYGYIWDIAAELLGGHLTVLRSERYDGMRDLVRQKGRVPSATVRFCTQYLKVEPMTSYVRGLDDEVTVYQGIRAEESESRAAMAERQWSDDYDAWIVRPLLRWSSAEVFAFLAKHGVEPNPLYRLGAGRVGCFPCVLMNHAELRRLSETLPEVWDRIAELEVLCGRSFFYPKFIPERFHTGHDPKSGKSFPTAEDVRRYVCDADAGQLALWEKAPPSSCLSIYNLCE
jgi:3'-phosphoadenosine 5'-phosphosulfate sulfotransferase (PAPS reductase)/FAD synthetase